MRAYPSLLVLKLGGQEPVEPFPANRGRDFYRNEALRWLAHEGELPKILPQFPGLDGGVGIVDEDTLAVCTLMGDVWLVDGVDEDLNELTWQRIAFGLHQPLGWVVHEGCVHVIGRDQLLRLVDLNGDREADFYECLTNEFPTAKGNRFAMPQEGSWQPASGIFEVGEGSYHWFFGLTKGYGKHGCEMPMCFIPGGIENSAGDVVFPPKDDRLGPLSGRMVGSSFGYCEHYLVLREEIGDGVQGGVMPLPGDFLSGPHRSRFNKYDGAVCFAGSDGWQSYAKESGSLERLRYTGKGR